MKKFRLANIYYYLPVFLLGLSISPNIVGWRIGLTLLVSLILVLPVTNYIITRLKELRGTTYSFKGMDAVVLLILILILWLSQKINYHYLLAQILFVFGYVLLGLFFTKSRIKVLFGLVVGVIFLATIYLGLNQYDYRMLFRKELLQFMVLAACLFSFLYMLVVESKIAGELALDNLLRQVSLQLGILYRITFIVFIIILWRSYPYEYSAVFLVLQIPVIYSYILFKKSIKISRVDESRFKLEVFRQFAVLCFIIFLIYLFLESTQVLQAVLGGY